nr:uncharacterized protein LOC115258827 [Aedes albopictus]
MPKKSKNVTNTGGIDNPCKKCNQILGDDNWVCCDVCESWVHFQCAGVNQSIADKSWKCGDCLADWDGTDVTSKSGVSFNESSVSKSSSRASQRLQLSLQHLEEQRKLSKLRAEEELQMKQKEEEARLKKLQMEEAAKLKQLDDEQEYLKQRYTLLMQIADEKDASSKRSGVSGKSRRTGVSVKSKRDQLEKWLKGAVVDEVGQSKPSSSGDQAALPVHAVSESVQPAVVTRESQLPVVSLPNSSSQFSVPSNVNPLGPASETIGNVPTLAKSYEQLLSGQGVSMVSSVPASAAERFVSSVPQRPVASSDISAILPRLLDIRVGNTNSVAVTLPTVTFAARDTVVSSAPCTASQSCVGSSGLMSTVYGGHPYYTAAPMAHLAPTNAVASGDFVRVNSSQSCFGSLEPDCRMQLNRVLQWDQLVPNLRRDR